MTRPALQLRRALESGPVLLDGGLSNQLEAQGCDLTGDLWSARLLADAPERLEAAHRAYVRAGARVVITSSYQASFEGFGQRGVTRREAAALLGRSVRLARAAAEDTRAWVAASVGPYGAVLADGSEYRGRYGLSEWDLTRFHRERVSALVAAEPDVLALETVPDVVEAAALLRATEDCGVPVWLSYTVRGTRTRAGQPLDEAFDMVRGHPHVLAAGVNCCTAQDADRAVETAATWAGKPVVVYPNSGERWDADGRRWHGPADFPARRVRDWVRRGARLVGGCCRVGPDEITELARELASMP
ncbi:homocysteine S-methyltransferase [Streptomyces oceani]|uniref:Homocysteine methyltransferase n=1 Tax=Streptomyces oceani TaxID=1075402 RepID=A0A1E7KKX2_9ACTN|nr:homocysteine S-methyltransferase [Streptomyces oceani]OEV04527.1 homocysteine methyltransferase [Streptomyces oceani]